MLLSEKVEVSCTGTFKLTWEVDGLRVVISSSIDIPLEVFFFDAALFGDFNPLIGGA
jgi:hypothetical protein